MRGYEPRWSSGNSASSSCRCSRDLALHARHVHALEHERDAAEAIARRLELLAQELRDAREDVDVLHDDERKPEIARVDQRRSGGHLGHLELARVGRLARGALDPARDRLAVLERAAERRRDPVDREVVVSRADPARREHEVVGLVHRAHVLGDHVDLIGNRDDALDVDAERAELAAQVRGVGVDDLPGEDLVSDHEDAGRGHGREYTGPRRAMSRFAARRTPPYAGRDGRRGPLSEARTQRERRVGHAADRRGAHARTCRSRARAAPMACAGAAAWRSRRAPDALPAETPEETRCKQRNRIDPALRLACRIRVTADLSVTAPYW